MDRGGLIPQIDRLRDQEPEVRISQNDPTTAVSLACFVPPIPKLGRVESGVGLRVVGSSQDNVDTAGSVRGIAAGGFGLRRERALLTAAKR